MMIHHPDGHDDDRLADLLCQYEQLLAIDSVSADNSIFEAEEQEPELAERLRAARRGVAALDRVRRRYLHEPHHSPSPDESEVLAAGSGETLTENTAKIGRFHVQRELGRGGLGVVFLAYDPGSKRQVALKVPRPESLANSEIQLRFVREAEAAARLNHPHVTSVFEVGQVGPVYFLATEFCSGPTLRHWLDDQQVELSTEVAACWIQQLASAVTHAHGRGVLHRDIKPSNVMLVRDDRQGALTAADADETNWILKLADFGMAKLLESDHGKDNQTHTGTLIGTLAYMSPEQAEGRTADCDVRTDVYGLGALLYELLTGRPPARGATDADTLRQVLFSEVEPPSGIRSDVPHDLEAICLKCLERDPRRRYASAQDLEADLRCYLAGEPVEARPPASLERLKMWARRRPVVATLTTVCCLALAVLAGFGVWYDYRLQRHYLVERQLRIQAQRHRDEAELSAQHAVDAQRATQQLLYLAKLWRTHEAWKANSMDTYFALRNELENLTPESDRDTFAQQYFERLSHSDEITLYNNAPDVFAVTYVDEKTVATGDQEGRIRLWDREDGNVIREFSGHQNCVNSFDVSDDGLRLASASCDGTIGIWDIAKGQLMTQLTLPQGAVGQVYFLSETEGMLAYGIDHSVSEWHGQRETWTSHIVGINGELATAAASANLKWAAEAALAPSPRLTWWSIPDGRSHAHRKMLDSHPQVLAFNHSGDLLAAVEGNGNLWMWDPKESAIGSPIATRAGALDIAFSHNDRLLAVAGDDLVVRLYDIASRTFIRAFKGHDSKVSDLAFSPDDSEIALATISGQVKIWRVEPIPAIRRLKLPAGDHFTAALSPNGKWVAVSRNDYSLWLHSLTSPDIAHELIKPETRRAIRVIQFSQDSTCLLADDREGDYWHAWDLSNGAPTPIVDPVAEANDRFAIDVSHSQGLRTIDGSGATELLIKRLDDDRVLHHLRELDQVLNAQFDLNGKKVIVCTTSGNYLWDLATDRSVQLENASGWAQRCQVSPAGDLFAIDFPARVVLYRIDDGRTHAVLHGHARFTGAMAFSPDGQTLATSSVDPTVQLWHVPTGQEMLTLDVVNQCSCIDLCFSEDGRTLFGLTVDGIDAGTLVAWSTR